MRPYSYLAPLIFDSCASRNELEDAMQVLLYELPVGRTVDAGPPPWQRPKRVLPQPYKRCFRAFLVAAASYQHIRDDLTPVNVNFNRNTTP